MATFLVMTAVALAIFVTGRYLCSWLGHWITYHFLTARLWSRAGLWLLGLRLVVRGTPIESGALVSNHCSWADILTLRAVKLLYFVAKSEVRDWPAVGIITAVTGTVFIERKRNHAKQQERMLRDRIAAEQLLIFFPEGTSTDGLRVLPFKSSLFSAFFYDHHAADLLIQPVTVRYIPAPGSGLPPEFYGWWGDMTLGSHVWAVMSRSFGGRAQVIFHQSVKPQAFGDRKALAEYCGAVVARGLTED
ncbi:MAG TPA: lysophospholipid acyltransferase family protein [Thermohalobaculum sp.]|nr:lysophospholipid acyltransferase family protein [Thermohalobaculum sp.]